MAINLLARVKFKRPPGKLNTARLVAYIPAGVEVDIEQITVYNYCTELARELAKPIRYGRHVFLVEGTVDTYIICPDSTVGRTWWSVIHENEVNRTRR